MKHLRIVICIFLTVTLACNKNDIPDLDFRQEMRKFIEGISGYAKSFSPGFIVIPQNGQELITLDGESSGPLVTGYSQAISGQGREDLFYGYDGDGVPTPLNDRLYMEEYLDRSKTAGNVILVTDYCSAHPDMLDSYLQNETKGYISFSSDHRTLDHVPAYPVPIFHENLNAIQTLDQAKNFLYLLNPETFPTKTHFLDSLSKTNFDLFIIDLFFQGNEQLTQEDVASLKTKSNGGTRLVICYMSIGEAENYRYYWQSGWEFRSPEWLDKANPDWPGNFKVRYWDPAWQAIIFGNDNSYLKRIIDAGFDGVYLDIVDAFEYYEE
ncbi:MAG: endo alpha-1,4 polygalactosaminidase [Bacteroidales bacterium]|nr:endo alpha-1,4 polygalactosaminidase [Bacteroidales bacterium]